MLWFHRFLKNWYSGWDSNPHMTWFIRPSLQPVQLPEYNLGRYMGLKPTRNLMQQNHNLPCLSIPPITPSNGGSGWYRANLLAFSAPCLNLEYDTPIKVENLYVILYGQSTNEMLTFRTEAYKRPAIIQWVKPSCYRKNY